MRLVTAQAGITFVEVMVVGAIAVLVMTSALMQYSHFLSNQRLQEWTESIASDLRAAQQISITRRETVIAVFATNLYTVAGAGMVVKRGELPPDLAVSPATVTFDSLGAPAAATTITLRSVTTGLTRQISVDDGTGRVRVD